MIAATGGVVGVKVDGTPVVCTRDGVRPAGRARARACVQVVQITRPGAGTGLEWVSTMHLQLVTNLEVEAEPGVDAKASIREPVLYEGGPKKVALIDCGAKYNIVHSLRERGLSVLRVPWNYDLSKENFDGLMVSNGPGDPQMCGETVAQIRGVIGRDIPVFGICMGHQLLSMAAGASTYKLKFGHRSQNQPVLEVGTNRCLVTSQNHGFAVDAGKLDRDWEEWFINLNDDTNEGIRHKSGRFMSVQFHPEATPGPVDAGYLFDRFRELIG